MKNGFTLSDIIPATPADIYAAWLSSAGHSAMTGSPARVDGNVGGTKVTFVHSDMPEEQVDSYRQGREDFYFKPMKAYFGE